LQIEWSDGRVTAVGNVLTPAAYSCLVSDRLTQRRGEKHRTARLYRKKETRYGRNKERQREMMKVTEQIRNRKQRNQTGYFSDISAGSYSGDTLLILD